MKKRIILSSLLASAFILVPRTSHARWLDVNSGRFLTMDSFEGDPEQPQSLHKYTYAEDDPVNNVDPTGNESIASVLVSFNISGIFAQISPTPMAAQVQQRARQLGTRASSAAFWPAYLNYDDYTQQEVWKKIGGGVGKQYGTPTASAPDGQNSCAARVSYGFNYGGAPIPRGAPDAGFNYKEHVYANKPGDQKYYIVKAGKINEYLTKTWGPPDSTPRTISELTTVKNSLMNDQVGIFSTKKTPGHTGVLKNGYSDPYVNTQLPVDVWKLRIP